MTVTRRAGLTVFAVEETTVQVSWHALPPGRWRFSVPGGAGGAGTASGSAAPAGPAVVVEGDGGPGAVVLDGLPPSTSLAVRVAGPGGTALLPFRTLAPPPGPRRCRIATVSDLHVGSHRVGMLPRIEEDGTTADAAARCARAALAEAVAWGADLVVVKGDVCQESTPANWDAIGPALAAVPVPLLVLAGNHDVGGQATVAAAAGLAAHGLTLSEGVVVHDVPGLRVVLVETVIPRWGHGSVRRRQDAAAAALAGAAADGRPAMVVLHHYLQRHAVPTFWPPGIPGRQARRFLDALAAANPATLVTSGHTHRHRRRTHGPVVVTEVGSTKDYPGTWAGYAVHDGGIRQVVRRTADPAAIRWTERVGDTLMGVWARWSPGTLDARCFTHTWPERPSS